MGFKDDKVYIGEVLKGNRKAFSNLVEKHKNWVFTIAFRIAGNREDAEEIAQDAFMKAYRSMDKYKGTSKFSTWLYSITYNTAISKVRKKKITTSPIEESVIGNFSEDDVIEDLSGFSGDEQQKLVTKVLDQLPAEENLIIRLFYLNENSIDEISEITGLSASNVKVRLHRIRKKMYVLLHGILEKEINHFI